MNNCISKNTPQNLLLNAVNDNFEYDEYNLFRSIIDYIIGIDNSFLDNLNLTNQCYMEMLDTFFLYELSISVASFPYYKKLILDSSKNKNDLSSFSNCINDQINYLHNFTYLTVLVNDQKSLYDILTTNEGISSFLYGLCLIDKCEIEDYLQIIKKGMLYLNLTKEIKNKNETDGSKDLELKIFKIDDVLKSQGFLGFLELLPFIIILVHLFFIIFNSIPLYIYKIIVFIFYCKNDNNFSSSLKNSKSKNTVSIRKLSKMKNSKKIKEKERISNTSYSSLNKNNKIKSIELLYNINNNYTTLMEFKKQNEITNDGGLSYINGIKGISMLFLLFGSVYSVLYSSLVTEQKSELFYSQLNNIFFSIFYIGIKYAPKLLLCSSGFSLFFKFICYLDGKAENEKDLFHQNNDNSIFGKEIVDIKNNTPSGKSSTSFQRINKSEKYDINKLISTKYILYFFGLQIHKYIIYIIIMCFIIFSLNWIISTFEYNGPIWHFFYVNFISVAKDFKYLFPLIIGYKSFFIPGISPEKDNILHYFYLVFQEIFYFIITSIIIFIGYKKNVRIDIFFKLIFIILIIFRVIYYFSKNGLDDKDYFGYSTFGLYYNSIVYDYSFYIIGIHFGMINYVIQKGYSIKDFNRQNKKYLESSLNLLNPLKKKNKKLLLIISILSIIIIIINIFIQQIIMYIIRIFKSNELQKNMQVYKRDFISQMIMLFDADFFVLAANAFSLCMYLRGGNLINDIFCHSLWSVFNRFYFSYILLLNPIILYIIYNIESEIVFDMSDCILYSFICGIFVFFISIIIYITFELPFRKVIRFWLKLNEEVAMKKRLSFIEASNSYCKSDNLLDGVTPSITDYNDDDEEEDDEY